MSDSSEIVPRFVSIGLSDTKAKETAANKSVSDRLLQAITEAERHGQVSKPVGVLLYHVATKIKSQCLHHVPLLSEFIALKKIASELQLDAALDYLLTNVHQKKIDLKDFSEACGVGVEVTPEDVERAVEVAVCKYKNEILEKRYRFPQGKLIAETRQQVKWADGKAIKNEVDLQILDLLGPKTDADCAKPEKVKKENVQSNSKKDKDAIKKTDKKNAKGDGQISNGISGDEEQVSSIGELMLRSGMFHVPGENYKTDGYVITDKTMSLLKKHVSETGGKYVTRFPPEPNGILHIGHAKAININFGFAQATGGICYLRYDDTNPEKEEEKFFVGIKEMVTWLGYTPYKVTHSSDYFDKLYELAVELIKAGHAYVCHQRAEEMKGFAPPASPWRDRPIQESLKLFADMRRGLIDEGQATLRMKVTLEEGKQDPVAYRIKFTRHHRTKDAWCVYPTYDYTHCLCDSLENISHSLCTKEFQARRSSYYWLCNVLGIYCPVQWEYGRLNVNYTVVSKRKIGKLIELGIVQDWDDPRLFTLTALRRRGFPPAAINTFCAKLGVTGAQMAVDPALLDATCRDLLNTTAPRAMAVLDPLKVHLTNLASVTGSGEVLILDVPDFPAEPSRGTHKVSLAADIYIDMSDFAETPEKGFRRLTQGQSVGLKHASLVISLEEVVREGGSGGGGRPKELRCRVERVENAPKPKAFIHWVAEAGALPCEVRLYERLFRHSNPEDPAVVPGGFVSDCRQDSLTVKRGLVDGSVLGAKLYDTFQFERVGFFAVDRDSTAELLVFNRTVSLKEDPGK